MMKIIVRILFSVFQVKPSVEITRTPPFSFSEDERRLFNLLPEDEQIEFARKYFSDYAGAGYFIRNIIQ